MELNLQVVGLFFGAVVILFVGLKFLIPRIKFEFDALAAKRFLEKIEFLAKMIANDEDDKKIDKVSDVLIYTLDYLNQALVDNNPNLEDTIEYVLQLLDEAGSVVGDNEKVFVEEAINLILDFLK